MDTLSVVKAVRLDNETIQRIITHMARLQALWGPAVWVNEGMALRDVILKGLAVVEASGEQEHASGAPTPATAPRTEQVVIPPEVPREPIPQHTTIPPEESIEEVSAIPQEASHEQEPSLTVEALVGAIAPEPPLTAPAHLRASAEVYPHAAHLSLDEFAEVLYEQNIYRAIDKGGHERPVNRGTLKKMLNRCKKLGLLK